jgi:enterochelin esterase family protein
VFGKVLSQSGAFSLFEQGSIVYDLVNCRERLPLDIWMDAGKYEWLLGTNQRMHELLKTKANKVEYREYNGGHNYTSWQNEVWRGLEYLFGKEDGKP